MADRDEEQELDEMLDSMLREYSAVEPRPGLKTRILANLNEVQAKHRSWSIVSAWAWAGAAAAVVLLVAFVFHLVKPAVQPPAARVKQATTSPAPPAPVNTAESNETASSQERIMHRARRPGARRVANNRPDVFPSPAPLSEQERLMFAYLANTPHREVVSQIQSNDQKEAAEFWADSETATGPQQISTTRGDSDEKVIHTDYGVSGGRHFSCAARSGEKKPGTAIKGHWRDSQTAGSECIQADIQHL